LFGLALDVSDVASVCAVGGGITDVAELTLGSVAVCKTVISGGREVLEEEEEATVFVVNAGAIVNAE
jgi:hypothetical protein